MSPAQEVTKTSGQGDDSSGYINTGDEVNRPIIEPAQRPLERFETLFWIEQKFVQPQVFDHIQSLLKFQSTCNF
jgi:hypothetical protein